MDDRMPKVPPRCRYVFPSCYPAWNRSTKISTLTLNSRCRKREPQQSRRTTFVRGYEVTTGVGNTAFWVCCGTAKDLS